MSGIAVVSSELGMITRHI